jgi:hypothetical protein
MKPTRTITVLTLALVLTIGAVAFAQSNNYRRRGNGNNYDRQRDTSSASQSSNVPGPSDYERFSSFITQRNIFDPNRYPRNSSGPTRSYTPRTPRYAPTFTLVGTMSYTKGMFAFFDGNQSNLRKVLTQSGNIANYTVIEVTQSGATLQSADKKQTLQLKIGDSVRQEGSTWLLAGAGQSYASSGFSEGESSTSGESSGDAASSAPPSASEPNDILKKLMQQREESLK